MKGMLLRSLMLVALGAAAMAVLIPVPLTAAPDAKFTVLELKQSHDDTVNLAKMTGNDQLALATLLTASVDDDAARFLADNENSATLRRVLIVKTEGDVYAVVAMSHVMNTPVPDNIVTAQNDTTRLGGRLYQINTRYDEKAAMLIQEPKGSWTSVR